MAWEKSTREKPVNVIQYLVGVVIFSSVGGVLGAFAIALSTLDGPWPALVGGFVGVPALMKYYNLVGAGNG